MKKRKVEEILEEFFARYPSLEIVREDLLKAYEFMRKSFQEGGKLLVCGNGGCAADCDHVVVELVKSSELRRAITADQRKALVDLYPDFGPWIADRLMGGLPAISLVAHSSVITAMSNDVCYEMIFAQQVFVYGKPNDILLGMSTSGSSENVLHAARMANALNMHTVALTGSINPDLKNLCDVAICSPEKNAQNVQEHNVAIYYVLTRLLENYFFD